MTSKIISSTLHLNQADILFIGTEDGATRINNASEVVASGVNFDIEGSVSDSLKLIAGGTNDIVNIHVNESSNIVSIVTSGTGNGLTYLDLSNGSLNSIDSSTVRGIETGTVSTGFISNAYGGIALEPGVISAFKQDLGVMPWSLRIINDEDIVDFGVTGTLNEFSLNNSEVGVISDADTVPIYNDNSTIGNANAVIGFSGKEEDSFIELAQTASGTFYGIRDSASKLPRDFPWENGSFQNTQVVNSEVTVSGEAGPYVYISPILDTSIVSPFNAVRTFWVSEEPGVSSIDFENEINGQYSIQYRQANTAPSGVWSPGQLAPSGEPLWDTVSGTLSYSYTPNYSIDELNTRYVQFKVNFNPHFYDGFVFGTDKAGAFEHVTESGSVGDIPTLSELGIEYPVRIYGIAPSGSLPLYVRSNINSPASGTSIKNTARHIFLDVWWNLLEE